MGSIESIGLRGSQGLRLKSWGLGFRAVGMEVHALELVQTLGDRSENKPNLGMSQGSGRPQPTKSITCGFSIVFRCCRKGFASGGS